MPRARLHPYTRDQGPLYIQPPNPRAQRALMVPANAPSCVKVLAEFSMSTQILTAATDETNRSIIPIFEGGGTTPLPTRAPILSPKGAYSIDGAWQIILIKFWRAALLR